MHSLHRPAVCSSWETARTAKPYMQASMLIPVACDPPTPSLGQIPSPPSDLQRPVAVMLPRQGGARTFLSFSPSQTGSHCSLALLLGMNKAGDVSDVEEHADQIVCGGTRLLISNPREVTKLGFQRTHLVYAARIDFNLMEFKESEFK